MTALDLSGQTDAPEPVRPLPCLFHIRPALLAGATGIFPVQNRRGEVAVITTWVESRAILEAISEGGT